MNGRHSGRSLGLTILTSLALAGTAGCHDAPAPMEPSATEEPEVIASASRLDIVLEAPADF